MGKTWTYDEMYHLVAEMALAHPRSDFGSHRAMNAIVNFVFDRLLEANPGVEIEVATTKSSDETLNTVSDHSR